MRVWFELAGILGLSWVLPSFLFRIRRLWIGLSAVLGIGSLCFPSLVDWLDEIAAPEALILCVSLLQKEILHGSIGTAFLLAVCVIGLFPMGHPLRRRMQKLRAPLSIALGFLILPHMILRLIQQFPPALQDGLLLFLYCNGLICFLLTLPLWITSFPIVRKCMKPRSWFRLQTLAYPLYFLVLAHGAIYQVSYLHSLWGGCIYLGFALFYFPIKLLLRSHLPAGKVQI